MYTTRFAHKSSTIHKGKAGAFSRETDCKSFLLKQCEGTSSMYLMVTILGDQMHLKSYGHPISGSSDCSLKLLQLEPL